MREERGLTGAKAEELAAETIRGGKVELAYDRCDERNSGEGEGHSNRGGK